VHGRTFLRLFLPVLEFVKVLSRHLLATLPVVRLGYGSLVARL